VAEYRARVKYDEQVALRYRYCAVERRAAENDVLARFLDRLEDGARLLDAPCGTGRVLELVAGRHVDYVGLDLSPSMLGHARQRMQQDSRGPRVALLGGDVEQLPFEDRSFDLTVSMRFLHHLPPGPLERVLDELTRVTGERLVLTFLHAFSLSSMRRRVMFVFRTGPLGRYSQTLSGIRAQMARRGFELEDHATVGFMRGLWFAAFVRRGSRA